MENHSTRGADWEHARCKSACLIRLSLLHRPRYMRFRHGFKNLGTEGKSRLKSKYVKKQTGKIKSSDTSVQILHAQATRIQIGCQTRTSQFAKQGHLRLHVQRHDPLGESESAKKLAQANEVGIYSAHFSLCCRCFCGPGPRRTMKNDHLSSLQTVNGQNSFSK